MKSKKRELRKPAAAAPAPRAGFALAAVCRPGRGVHRGLGGRMRPRCMAPFLFDDTVLPFALPGARLSVRAWIGGVRPMTMFTYWVNAQLSGDDPFSYHVAQRAVPLRHQRPGVSDRAAPAGMGGRSRRRGATCWRPSRRRCFCCIPAQTESVAYLAGRAEASA